MVLWSRPLYFGVVPLDRCQFPKTPEGPLRATLAPGKRILQACSASSPSCGPGRQEALPECSFPLELPFPHWSMSLWATLTTEFGDSDLAPGLSYYFSASLSVLHPLSLFSSAGCEVSLRLQATPVCWPQWLPGSREQLAVGLQLKETTSVVSRGMFKPQLSKITLSVSKFSMVNFPRKFSFKM